MHIADIGTMEAVFDTVYSLLLLKFHFLNKPAFRTFSHTKKWIIYMYENTSTVHEIKLLMLEHTLLVMNTTILPIALTLHTTHGRISTDVGLLFIYVCTLPLTHTHTHTHTHAHVAHHVQCYMCQPENYKLV